MREYEDYDVGTARCALDVWVRDYVRGKFDPRHVLYVLVLHDMDGVCVCVLSGSARGGKRVREGRA